MFNKLIESTKGYLNQSTEEQQPQNSQTVTITTEKMNKIKKALQDKEEIIKVKTKNITDLTEENNLLRAQLNDSKINIKTMSNIEFKTMNLPINDLKELSVKEFASVIEYYNQEYNHQNEFLLNSFTSKINEIKKSSDLIKSKINHFKFDEKKDEVYLQNLRHKLESVKPNSNFIINDNDEVFLNEEKTLSIKSIEITILSAKETSALFDDAEDYISKKFLEYEAQAKSALSTFEINNKEIYDYINQIEYKFEPKILKSFER